MKILEWLMVSTFLSLGAMSAARAQMAPDSVDMSTFTCEQLLAGTSDSLLTAVWLSGYYNGLRQNTKLSLSNLQRNSELVTNECRSHPKQTVMQTVNTLLSSIK